jgi:hypothetical protein
MAVNRSFLTPERSESFDEVANAPPSPPEGTYTYQETADILVTGRAPDLLENVIEGGLRSRERVVLCTVSVRLQDTELPHLGLVGVFLRSIAGGPCEREEEDRN